LREQYRRKANEEHEQQHHIQQIDSDVQTMTVANTANCCLLNKTDLEVKFFWIETIL
jgi:hypothetical protein